jgi:bla regulator protein blaR1
MPVRWVRTSQLGIVLAGASVFARAQEAAPQLPTYDVSVIRPAAGLENGDRHVWTRLNTLDVKNMPILNLLQSAFDVPRDMIVGLPEWAKHERLDIEAKTLDPDVGGLRELTAVQRRAMLQALFKDRLGLQWHYETKVLTTYELLVANGGSKLKPTVATGQNSGVSVNDTRFRLTNIPVGDLAVVLADKLGRPVVDKTGLTGRYDAVMEWTADTAVPSGDADVPPPLFTALQEQLGLKLVGGKDPVQVFVIDRLVASVGN